MFERHDYFNFPVFKLTFFLIWCPYENDGMFTLPPTLCVYIKLCRLYWKCVWRLTSGPFGQFHTHFSCSSYLLLYVWNVFSFLVSFSACLPVFVFLQSYRPTYIWKRTKPTVFYPQVNRTDCRIWWRTGDADVPKSSGAHTSDRCRGSSLQQPCGPAASRPPPSTAIQDRHRRNQGEWQNQCGTIQIFQMVRKAVLLDEISNLKLKSWIFRYFNLQPQATHVKQDRFRNCIIFVSTLDIIAFSYLPHKRVK